MVATEPTSEHLHETFLRQGQVKHALKTAMACCLATALAFYFHLENALFAPLLTFILMTRGMPNPNLNWLLTLVAVGINTTVSALLLLAFEGAPYLYVALMLLWIFISLLFANWFPLPATLAVLVSAISIFVKLYGTVGETLAFYLGYGLNLLFAGLAVIIIHNLLWPLTAPKVFLQTLAEVYDNLEERCRQAATRIRSGEAPQVVVSAPEWAPFRPLRQALAPELRWSRDTSNPFARMILACRSLNLRLWFFNKSVAPMVPAIMPAEVHQPLADLLGRCAGYLHTLFEGAVHRQPVPPMDAALLEDLESTRWAAGPEPLSGDVLLTWRVLNLAVQDLQSVTVCHNALLASLRRGLMGGLSTLKTTTIGKPLIDENSLHASAKLVIMLLLLLLAEVEFSLPGGQHAVFATFGGQNVAFFATFFASTGNLGQQNKADLVGSAGLLAGFAYGVVAAFLTSHQPQFPLLLALVLLGEYLAALVFFTVPRYSIAGFQAGLALFFAYLATPGPEWGSFTLVWTRFAGLVVAGFTAIVIHAYLWPVLPMRQLRDLIAAALKDTAESLGQLFSVPRAAWKGTPKSLGETVRRARDLLDDARYLPGPDHADPAYQGILMNLQEIDANLEFVHFLIGLEKEHSLRVRLFQESGDYADQARKNLDHVTRQFQRDLNLAAGLEAIHWEPDVLGRWRRTLQEVEPSPESSLAAGRTAVIARCLDQIAQATERISAIVGEINIRNARS